MAGDYIPWNKGLYRKPEVSQIARMTGLSLFDVAGRLMAIWEWADDNTINGHIDGASADTVDMIAICPGFAAAMARTRPHSWIVLDDDGVMFPNYERWNGRCAKKRLIDADRQRRHRRLSA